MDRSEAKCRHCTGYIFSPYRVCDIGGEKVSVLFCTKCGTHDHEGYKSIDLKLEDVKEWRFR